MTIPRRHLFTPVPQGGPLVSVQRKISSRWGRSTTASASVAAPVLDMDLGTHHTPNCISAWAITGRTNGPARKVERDGGRA